MATSSPLSTRLADLDQRDVPSTAAEPSRRSRAVYLYDLLAALVVRDLKLRYKRSALGVLWSLLGPLAQMLIFTFLFHRVLPLNISSYPVFVFGGLLVWSWFSTSLGQAAGAITESRELIRRPGFPVNILPVVSVTTNLVHLVLALPILLLFSALGGGQLTAALVALPIVVAVQFAFTLSLAYLVATLNVTYRDTQHLLGVLLLLLFYLTPIFYSAESVPLEFAWLYSLNPMVHLVAAYRAVFIYGLWPDGPGLFVLSLLAGGLLWLGRRVFTRASYRFVEEL
jgi:lipopolysaccharide transport system permease protein